MKNSCYIHQWSVVVFLLTLVLVFLSWIGSIYGGGDVQSLLSTEGIRWELRHVITNFVQAPALGICLILFMGIGIGVRAGMYNAFIRCMRKDRLLSKREKRAIGAALVVGLLYVLIVFLSIPFLKSVTGTFSGSPFSKGVVYISSIGLGLEGVVYGYVSNRFRSAGDIVEGMSCLITRYADFFVSLFLVVQLFSVLEYTRLDEWVGLDEQVTSSLFQLCCYFPLILCSIGRGKNGKTARDVNLS